MRLPNLSLPILAALLAPTLLLAQGRTLHWVGGDGQWGDPARWSLAPGGAGGAGVPTAKDDAVIAPAGEARVALEGTVKCRSLRVDGDRGFVGIAGGAGAELRIHGDWAMNGSVHWAFAGTVRLEGEGDGWLIDLRGIPLQGGIAVDGPGSWSVVSDLALPEGDLTLRAGEVHASRVLIRARSLRAEGRGAKRLHAGSSVIELQRRPEPEAARALDAQQAVIVVAGEPRIPPPSGGDPGGPRDVHVCATEPGQTPFTATTSALTNYNGFNIRCRGECNATVTVTVQGGIGPFTYSWLNGGPNTATWTDACGGPQIVIVTDVGQGVSCGVTLNVTEPTPLGVIFFGAGTPPTCADVCNGSRTAVAVGGVSPYSYSWNNGAGSGPSFSGLCAGPNTLRITDANGCIRDTTFVFDVQPIAPNLTFTNVTCNGACNGTATVNPTGGTGAITAVWTPAPGAGQGTFNATGLCAGPYSVLLTDANGCTAAAAFTITEPPPITPNPAQVNATCFGQCDGSASVAPTGSPGPFTYQWTPNVSAGASAINLCAGAYSVLITDQVTGCTATAGFTIASQPAFDVQGSVTPASCSDACDGAISITIGGPPPPYAITWSPPVTGQGTVNATALCPGAYSVTVATANGCDTTVTFAVPSPPPLLATLTPTDASCAGVCDGSASVAVSGGTPGYSFFWSPAPGAGQGTQNATGLCAGPHTLLITDANGCDTLINFIINDPPPLQAALSQTNVTCGGLCDGTASVAVSGGTPAYSFFWSPAPGAGQGTPNATGLCAGTYSVLITDANGCTLTQAFTIVDAVPLQVALQVLPATCSDACDGSAGAVVTGGQGPYAYSWLPTPAGGQGTPNATGLCAQAYTLLVADAAGCDTLIAFTVPAPTPITVQSTVDSPDCAGDCNGSIALQVSGGTGVFTYLWTPDVTGQGTPNATGLCPGSYQVTITSGACDTTLTFLLSGPPPIAVDLAATPASCGGLCDGTATAVVNGGAAPYIYDWQSPPGGGQGTPTATGYCPGAYTLTVTDANGCSVATSFAISTPSGIDAQFSTTPTSCGTACDGTATVIANGGVEPYTWLWTPVPGGGQGTPNATGLCQGSYTLQITDAAQCDTVIFINIIGPAPITPNASQTDEDCNGPCNGTATVNPAGGSGAFTYTWSPTPPVGQFTNSASGLCPGLWSVTIADGTGCDTTVVFDILPKVPIDNNLVWNNATCPNACDGSAQVFPTGGIPPYTIVWSPPPPVGQGTDSASGLCLGLWNVAVIDAVGCAGSTPFFVEAPAPFNAGLVVNPENCA
ncbi:MAG: SprB repeat-containing protein, partial [Flavobacteriales bacterium]